MPRCSIVPSSSASIGHRSAAWVLVPALVVVLAGCRPPSTSTATATPTSSPTATAPAARARRPTFNPTATATPPSTPTPEPTVTVDWAAPVPVAMTLEEGKAAVMRWIASADAPRIEWAGYVRGDKLAARVVPQQLEQGEDVFIRDQFGGVYEGMDGMFPARIPNGPLIVVFATAGRLEAPLFRVALPDLGEMCCIGTGPPRQNVLGIFDAQSGHRVAAVQDPPEVVRALIQSSTIHTPTVRATPVSLVPTPTATPVVRLPSATPSIAFPTLTADNVTVALRPVLSAYPLLPGSRWTWIVRSAEGGVTWDEVRMTETVRAAWLLDERHAVVHSVRERTLTSGDPGLEIPYHEMDEIWRTVSADGGVYSYPADRDGCGNDPSAASESVAADIGLPMEALTHPHNQVTWTCVFHGSKRKMSVSTPGGTFDDCRLVFTLGGNSWASTRAVCRGVGYVESDSWHTGTWHGGYTVMQLESYDVVLPR